jgi:translation elongation factor P/translation initiation factor 5A
MPSTSAFVVAPNHPASSPRISSPLILSVAVDTSEIKNGLTVEIDGEPYKVLSFSIMKQARGAAKTTIKFKNLLRGSTIENTYRSGEKFETALIEKVDAQFTYQEGVRQIYKIQWVVADTEKVSYSSSISFLFYVSFFYRTLFSL